MTELVFKMPTRNRPVTGSDSTSEGDVGRFRKDSSTASQHSTDETHDLPPIVGAPNSTVASRYALPPDSQQNGGPGSKENYHPGGMLPHNIRSNSLYESHQGSPSLRRRLKVLIRQKSEPDMLMGRDLGLNSPRMRRMIAPSPPPGDSPRSQGGSDCNSPRIIRKPRSFHGHGSSPRTPKSAENSPMIHRRSIATVSQPPTSTQTSGSETIDGMRQTRSHSTGSRADASSISANPSAPGSPFTMRREVNLRKAAGTRLEENPNQTDFLPAVNGNSDGCVTQPITSQESRRSFASDDDSTGFMSMETVQSSLYEHVAPEDRYGHSRGPLSVRKQQPPNQLQHDAHHYQQQEGYHHHHHHQHQLPQHPHPPQQMPNGNSWVERNPYADCSPPPTNSPTRELENPENMRESFNSSYSSGSAERIKFEEVSNEDKRRDNSLYDIEEAREQTDDVPDDNESDCNNDEKVMQDNAESDSERKSDRKDNENDNNVQPPPVDERNSIVNGNADVKENNPINKGENSNDSDEESGNEDDDYSDDSYEDTVPEYQKAPMSTKLRVKNWLAGLEKADNESSSRIDRFLPEII